MRPDSHRFTHAGPVVIGGLGGSGTRVIAEILLSLGYYLGPDLNRPKDNVWFTLLFKRPKWFRRVYKKEHEIYRHLRIFEAAMQGNSLRTPGDISRVISAANRMAFTGHAPHFTGAGIWPFQRAVHMLRGAGKIPPFTGWGWKEPNTHIYLPWLIHYYRESNFRYILTVRHGLDMAFSGNQQQLHTWHWFYDIERPKKEAVAPEIALKYWVRANQKACEYGAVLGSSHFLCVNYDTLCKEPESEIKKLLAFLQLEPSDEEFKAACAIPRIPKTMERYKSYDYSVCAPEDIDAVRHYGFTVE